jgi:inward rectifier potassium channel
MFEILVGLVLMAILTGLMFARFSRPTAKVIFSQVAVICPYNGIPTLMFRAANQRESKILEAQVQVTLLRNEVSPEGHKLRHFYDLHLMRSRTPVFGLSWLIMHPILEGSPFFGETSETLKAVDAELWVTLSGSDETFSQTVHARYMYTTQDMLWNRSFVDIFSQDEQGEWFIDLTNFHEVVLYED